MANLQTLIKSFKKIITKHYFYNDELVFYVEKENLLELIQRLKEDKRFLFRILIDISAIDYPTNIKERFTVVYNLLSIEKNLRLRINVPTNSDSLMPSITSMFSAANWYEREVWDMFGILFQGNNDLRRILTDYGFSGHPLRKDFPLTGHVEVRYDDKKSKVIYEPVSLPQEYRNFDFKSPWEGEEYILPGDEKATK